MKNTSIFALGLFLLVAVSCSKEEERNVDQQLLKSSSEIDVTNELDFNAGIDITTTNSSYSARPSENTISNDCLTITVDNPGLGVFPKTFVLDYGTGCTFNGITRSGTLTITLTDYLMNTGSVMTVERGDDYYINGRKLEGTITYTNTTSNPTTPQWERTIVNGGIITLNGNYYNFSGERVVTMTEGVGTTTLADNVYEISAGTHTISNLANGATINLTIVEPLIKKYACMNISQGKLALQGAVLDGILDYGDNTCDNQAIYTHSNGNQYNVTLF
ncbi:MAG TPA: hypothetical protein PLL09_05985 [Flavobacterium sp.]|uniref:hypothetical protein n=1 Tax=unclassified Flavobacterium TaxID=196869 RepID=UPI0025BE4021|nr:MULTISPECIES: hypothetical protein [unclassified Flavobacterium]HRE77359.1 hypothetical protein [Flavobacterium sp.]